MLVLGIDTATEATSVAVHDGQRVLAERTTVDPRRHAEAVGPAIADVVRSAQRIVADITAVAVGVGPGPYTGLRVGIATALALADGLGVPAYGVCSLDVLARQIESGTPITVVTDARRREVFWATYDADGKRISGPSVGRPADVAAIASGPFVGPGAALYRDVFGAVSAPKQLSAGMLCVLAAEHLGEGAAVEPVRPVYLRRPDTAAPATAKPVLQP
ncbi:MAG: tRNA (adenosine(37)-N6)-threonylcarbamoyltransferase complex dimerization subunit type 1 TsaB [Actinomycetes bacterium]